MGFACFVIGWFGGREYLKYEIRSTMQKALAPLIGLKEQEQPAQKTEPKPSLEQPSAPPNNKNVEVNSQWPTTWHYSTTNDEMRGTSNKSATLASLNEVNLGFPYERTRLSVVISDMYQGNVGFFTNAQFKCNDSFESRRTLCKIAVRFDNNPIEYLNMSKRIAGSDILIMDEHDAKTFINRVRNAKKLIVEVDMFKYNSQQFNFDVSGFTW